MTWVVGQISVKEDKNFYARLMERKEIRHGAWKVSEVGVFEGEKQIGGYQRNYPNYAETTFAPFVGTDQNWYALYAKDYTCTQVLSLPDCRNIGGETPDQFGFCPVELYVPRFYRGSFEFEGRRKFFWTEKVSESALLRGEERYDMVGFSRYGFVSGCIWGDDTSWKVEVIDLIEVHNGILKRWPAFGYVDLPAGLTLKDAIQIMLWDDANGSIKCVRFGAPKMVYVDFDEERECPVCRHRQFINYGKVLCQTCGWEAEKERKVK